MSFFEKLPVDASAVLELGNNKYDVSFYECYACYVHDRLPDTCVLLIHRQM